MNPETVSPMTNFLLAVLATMSPVFLAILGWIAKMLGDWISATTKSKTLVRLSYAVVDAVKYVEQTTVAQIRAAQADGSMGGPTITPQEVAEIKAKAIEAAKDLLGPKGVNEVMHVLGIGASKLGDVLEHKVEAAVHDIRTDDKIIRATADLPRLAYSSLPPARTSYPPR